jgi:hypothetical protein
MGNAYKNFAESLKERITWKGWEDIKMCLKQIE